jgi:hypothetical protein
MGWLISAWFATLGVAALVGTLRTRSWRGRVSGAAHTLMCLAMAVMPWPAAADVPAIATVLVFSAGALWFVGLASLAPESTASPSHHEHRFALGYHALMMAAMAWMAVAMSGSNTSGGMEMDHGAARSSLPGWAGAVTLGFAAVFVVGATWFVVRLARPSTGSGADEGFPPVVDHLLGLGMAVGIGGALLTMT